MYTTTRVLSKINAFGYTETERMKTGKII